MWGDNSSTCGGITAVHVGDSFSTVEGIQYMQRDNISTVGDNISTVEGIQYSGRIPSVQWGIPSVQWGVNISTVEVAQYSGDKDLPTEYYEFSKNLEIFSRAYFASKSDRPHHRTQLLTKADMVKDLGYKNLGEILL